MAQEPLTHNPLNGVTAGVWRQGTVVHKVLTKRREAPPHWASSEDPRHWNYWRREALVYETGLPERLGLGAPRLLELTETPEGDVELVLEHVEGRHSGALGVEDLEATAAVLGRAQGRADVPDEPWLSRRFLRDYSGSRLVDWTLLDDDEAWAQPLMREHFDDALRRDLVQLHRDRERLLALIEGLPRTVCHLDVWPNNLIRRAGGEVAFVDWAFAGDGALGEDVGNLRVARRRASRPARHLRVGGQVRLAHRLLPRARERRAAPRLRPRRQCGRPCALRRPCRRSRPPRPLGARGAQGRRMTTFPAVVRARTSTLSADEAGAEPGSSEFCTRPATARASR
jgi:hypothetical protein